MNGSPAPTSPRARVRSALAPVRRVVLAHRRLLAAVLAAAAVATGVQATRPPTAPAASLVVASRDLPAGATLAADDLTSVRVEPDRVPVDAVTDPTGEVLAAPVRAGEPITDVRLVGQSLTVERPDLAAVPVRLPDAGMAGLLHAGDTIDVVAADPQADSGAAAVPVTSGAVVLALPGSAADEAGSLSSLPGRLVVLGVDPGDVPLLAQASVRDFLTFTWSRV